mgnify:CR=1 FL=1
MEKLIENRSNYKNLITYQKANTIFCMTYYFCEKYLTKGDRTVDQMIQAADQANRILSKVAPRPRHPPRPKSN